jgi:zeaxanthin glucosyltransferase
MSPAARTKTADLESNELAIPVTYDRPGVAARIADKQTGVVTSLDKLSAHRLSTLLNEVLNNPSYRDNARKLQKAIAEANGLSIAADLLEKSLGARSPCRAKFTAATTSAVDDFAATA